MDYKGEGTPKATGSWITLRAEDGRDMYLHPNSIRTVSVRHPGQPRLRLFYDGGRATIRGDEARQLLEALERGSILSIEAEL